MSSFDQYLEHEEQFYNNQRRANRKDRKDIQSRDRSKYKKSNSDQLSQPHMHQEPALTSPNKRGRVLSISSGFISVYEESHIYYCSLKGRLKKERTQHKNLICVGDWVYFTPSHNNEGCIYYIETRTSALIRADHFSKRTAHFLASNINQVFIVMSVISPLLKPALIDRYLLAAKNGNMNPIIIINKIDLLTCPSSSNAQITQQQNLLNNCLAAYKHLNIPILPMSSSCPKSINQLRTMLNGHASVFSGQSGVGKTSLINAVLNKDLPVGPIIKKTNKGSHTTTQASLIALSTHSFCIDTPGIKSFSIWAMNEQSIISIYPEFLEFSTNCQFPNCTHIHEPYCSVKDAISKGDLNTLRYHNYCQLIKEPSCKHWD